MSDLTILSKIKHLTYKEVRRQILYVDDELCTETFVSNLIQFAPNKDDDTKMMEKYVAASEEERLELDFPDQFIVEV